jgi:hypothetical protein
MRIVREHEGLVRRPFIPRQPLPTPPILSHRPCFHATSSLPLAL